MKRILIIDDDCFNEEESIQAGFAGTEIEVFLCSNKDDGIKWIDSKALFDCIVLDWYLEEENSTLSQLILKHIEHTYYSPVLIYSNHAENFRQSKDSGVITYPDNLIQEVDKGDFTDIRTKVANWLNSNTTAKLSNIYLKKIYEHIHKTFWGLNDIPHGNIASVYKRIIYENGNIDWTGDFIITLLLQGIISDNIFRQDLTALISQLQTEGSHTTREDRQKITSKILYSKSNPSFISNGDIVKVFYRNVSSYAIVITPDCDLAQKKTRYIELTELIENSTIIAKKTNVESIQLNKSESVFYLPSVPVGDNALIDLFAVFKATHFIFAKDNKLGKYPNAGARVKYVDSFFYNDSECNLIYVCSLLNPYKSEMLHKKTTHDSRVGIPGVYEYLKG